MSERTDLPWAYTKSHQNLEAQVWDAAGKAVLFFGDDVCVGPIADERAKRIAIAVNNHDAMVEALRVFLGGDPGLQISLGGNPNYIDAFLYKARALLAKIGGEG